MAVAVALRRREQRYREEIKRAISEWMSAPNEETPSPFAMIADQICTLLAARLVQQVKAMLAGTESGLSKQATQLEFEGLTANASPWLGVLANVLPKRIRGQLMKNPQMVAALSKLGNHSGDDGSNHTGSSVADRLRRNGG